MNLTHVLGLCRCCFVAASALCVHSDGKRRVISCELLSPERKLVKEPDDALGLGQSWEVVERSPKLLSGLQPPVVERAGLTHLILQ